MKKKGRMEKKKKSPLMSRCCCLSTISGNLLHPFLSLPPEMTSWPGPDYQRFGHFLATGTRLGMNIWPKPINYSPDLSVKLSGKRNPLSSGTIVWEGATLPELPWAVLTSSGEGSHTQEKGGLQASSKHLVQASEATCTLEFISFWTQQISLWMKVLFVDFDRWKKA